MAAGIPRETIWAAMAYVPPKGRCNYKASLMSSACPCLRFMLHPVKAATSFECDGCAHHASFHSLENQAEDAILEKWKEQDANNRPKQAIGGASKKRKMIADKPANDDDVIELLDNGEEVDMALEEQLQQATTKRRGGGGKQAPSRATKGR